MRAYRPPAVLVLSCGVSPRWSVQRFAGLVLIFLEGNLTLAIHGKPVSLITRGDVVDLIGTVHAIVLN